MRVWVIQEGEPITFVDGGNRLFRTEMLVNRLVERGHSVLRWSSTFDHLRKTFRFCDARDVLLGSNLRYHFLHSPTAYRKNLSMAHGHHNREIRDAFLKKIAEEVAPDLIFCSLPPLPLAQAAADYAHRYHIPLVFDIRDSWPDSILDNMSVPKRWLWELFLRSESRRSRRLMQRPLAITAISQGHLRWALKLADRQQCEWDRVFPMAYEEPPQCLFQDERERLELYRRIGAKPQQKLVTAIGRIGSAFDFNLLVRLAEEFLREGRDDVHFILAGEDVCPSLFRWRKRYPKNLSITGWLDQRHLQQILSLTTVGLLPYKHIHCPALRNKPLDFLSFGVPLLSSLRGDVDDLIRERRLGLTFTPSDIASLRRSLDFLLINDDLRKNIHQRALETFHSDYTAAKIYPSFVAYLEELMTSWKRFYSGF